VVVSMGGVAGSGGYWVSMGADRIVASPGTITGSIGVVYGKLVARGLFERVGITTDEVHRGDNALLMSTFRPFTEEQRAKNDAFLDRVYDAFVDRVAAGRGLDRAHVHEVARGRVWTGADARSAAWSTRWAGTARRWRPRARWRASRPTRRSSSRSCPTGRCPSGSACGRRRTRRRGRC
jgi:signal peptide peptidase SppA